MNIDDMPYGQLRQIAEMFGKVTTAAPVVASHEPRPVVVWTDKRGVIFGYTTDVNARPITLTNARMCLYWSEDVGGVFGLCEIGPTAGCKISATLPSAVFEGVTGVAAVSEKAVAAWIAAKVQGRK